MADPELAGRRRLSRSRAVRRRSLWTVASSQLHEMNWIFAGLLRP
jgi:hypothetical protein